MPRSHRLAPATVWAAFALSAAACGSGAAGGASVETTDSAGVVIVRNRSADLPLMLASEAVRSLGGKETDEESFYRVGSWNVGTDASGNIYVLDRQAYRVQAFDSAGRHLWTRGRQGGGPGELRFPFTLAVAGDGRLWVVDVGKRSLVHWGSAGEVLPSEPVPQGYIGGEAEWTSAGLVMPLEDPASGADRLVLLTEAREQVVLSSIPATDRKPIHLASCGMGFSGMAPIFSPSLVWTASASAVVVARNPEYVLDVYEDGRLVRSVRRDVPPRPATAELARASLGEGMRVRTEVGERLCDAAEVVEQLGFASHLPTVARIALAPSGVLWVERYGVGDEPKPVDVFDREGRYLGTLPAGSPFPIGFLPDGRILVVEEDELDVQRLVVRTASFPGS